VGSVDDHDAVEGGPLLAQRIPVVPDGAGVGSGIGCGHC
jgi:hypothetical protein